MPAGTAAVAPCRWPAGRLSLCGDDRLSTLAAPAGRLRIALTLFLPFALGYLLSYLLRTVNAVIADDLAADIGVDPAGLGLLTSAYFVSFAAAQIPLGILLDRYGPRRVEASLLVVAALGAWLFSVAETLPSLTAARAVIGLGVSACLMAAFKNTVLWWPPQRLPLINGLILAFGGLGALFATTPVATLLEVTDWRGVFRLISAVTLLCAAYILLAVPEPASGGGDGGSIRDQLRASGRIFADRFFWRVVPMSVMVQATFMAYLGLWAAPWLRAVNGFDRAAVAFHLQAIAAAMIAGYVLTGLLTDRLARLGIRPVAVFAGVVALYLINQATLLLPGFGVPLVQWALFGFLATASILGYAILTQAFPTALAGRVNTALNLMSFVTTFVVQTGVGVLIARFDGADGVLGHRIAFAILFGLSVAAFAWFVWPRRPQPADNGAN